MDLDNIDNSTLWTKKITDKKLKTKLRKNERQVRESALKAAKAEILLADEVGYLEAEGMEKTFKFRQQDIVKEVDVTSAQKVSSDGLILISLSLH